MTHKFDLLAYLDMDDNDFSTRNLFNIINSLSHQQPQNKKREISNRIVFEYNDLFINTPSELKTAFLSGIFYHFFQRINFDITQEHPALQLLPDKIVDTQSDHKFVTKVHTFNTKIDFYLDYTVKNKFFEKYVNG